MRCRECNVDLSENYTKCPLCGSAAQNDEAKVKGITPAPYPHNKPVTETEFYDFSCFIKFKKEKVNTYGSDIINIISKY